MEKQVLDLIVVGGGPAGLVCGIEAEKAGLNYLILEKGLLVNSIYNFPTNMTFFSTSKKLEIGGVPFISHTEKPTRKEALEYYRRITLSMKLNIKYREKVEKIKKQKDHFKILTKESNYQSKYVIIATGFYDHPRLLNIPGEDLLKVKHYYDDAHPYLGRKVLVVGSRNSACDVALETWRQGAEVTMVIRAPQLYEKVKYWIRPNIENRIKEGSIKVYFNSNLTEITETKVKIQTADGLVELENDHVLAMTGYHPDYEFFKKIGFDIQPKDLKPIVNEHLESSIQGLYLAGVIISGLNTSELFIENTRDHGAIIIADLNRKGW